MTKEQRRNDINDRFFAVLAEKNCCEKQSEQYQELCKIAKLILSEFTIQGRKLRHVMFMNGTHYDYKIENY